MVSLGKALIVVGLTLAVLGAALWGLGPSFMPGRLPGDFYARRGNFAFYFPITTAIVVSVVASLIAAWLRR